MPRKPPASAHHHRTTTSSGHDHVNKTLMTSIPVFPQGDIDGIHGELWRQWNHVLHGLPVDKFSAWKILAPTTAASVDASDDAALLRASQPIQVLAFVLNSFDDFDRWLTRENAQDGLYYRKVAQSMREKQGAEYLMYHCHKSGKARLKSDGERKRKQRETATKKLGFICSSKLVVRKHTKDGLVSWKKSCSADPVSGKDSSDVERVPVLAGQVSVIYNYTHSHAITESDVRETPISDHTRRLIKVWRALGFSVEEIYDNLMAARSEDTAQAETVGIAIPTTREAHISKRDLRNILVAAGMYKRENISMMHLSGTGSVGSSSSNQNLNTGNTSMHHHHPMMQLGDSNPQQHMNPHQVPANNHHHHAPMSPALNPLSESDHRSADLLVSELRDKYGTGDDPVPPPFWGSQLIEDDARSARLMIELFTNLQDAAKNLEDLGLLMDKQETYVGMKDQLDHIRMSTLMNTSRRLLFPNYNVMNTAATGQMLPGSIMPTQSSTEEELTDASNFMVGSSVSTDDGMGKPQNSTTHQQEHYVV